MKNLQTTKVYDAYWEFAKKRQDVFFARLNNKPQPWTDDPILQTYKFTNAYRASDRVSQYLIRNVIYSNKNHYSDEDVIFRILLFKLFNKIETWEFLEQKIGDITYKSYSFERYGKILEEYEHDNTIYSGAYIMPSGKSCYGYDKKFQNNLKLIEYLFKHKIANKIATASQLKDIYDFLLSAPSLGSFLAFQYAIDINYSELCDFSEMSFVVAGPGAISGIHKCFKDIGNYTYEDIIKYVAENQKEEFDKHDLDFKNLFGRDLQLIDCQNLFCETNKYARVAYPDIESQDSRTRIKQQYKLTAKRQIEYFYPPKWGIKISED